MPTSRPILTLFAVSALPALTACSSAPSPKPQGLSPAVMEAIGRVERRRAAEARVPEDRSVREAERRAPAAPAITTASGGSDVVSALRVDADGVIVDVQGPLTTAAAADLIARLAGSGSLTVTTGPRDVALPADGPMRLRDGSVASEDPAIRSEGDMDAAPGGIRRRR